MPNPQAFLGELSPAARQFAPDFPIFKQIGRTGASRYTPSLRNDAHGRVYIYTPESITHQEFDEMRFDGQIRAGLMLIKLPVMQSPWSITCSDPDIAAFCTEILKPIWPSFIRQMLLALDFGFSVFEKLWTIKYDLHVTQTQGNLKAVKERVYPYATSIRKMMHLDPTTLYLLAYRWSGDFAGVRQYIANSGIIPAQKCFIFSNDIEFEEHYGVSRTKPCYPYWVFKKLIYEFTNIYYETYSIPMKKGRYPIGQHEIGLSSSGEPVYEENEVAMLNLLEEMRNNYAVAIPSNRYEDGQYQWEIEPFEAGRGGGDAIAYIDHLNFMILKSLLVPQLALEVGGQGSYALAQTQVDFFFLGEKALMNQIAEGITEQMLRQIVKMNFGPKAPIAMFNFQPISTSLTDGLTNVLLQTLGQGRPLPMSDGSGLSLDWQWLSENLGVPVTTLEKEDVENISMVMARQEMIAQGMDPDQTQPQTSPQGQPNYGSSKDGSDPTSGGVKQTPPSNQNSDGRDEDSANMESEWKIEGNRLIFA